MLSQNGAVFLLLACIIAAGVQAEEVKTVETSGSDIDVTADKTAVNNSPGEPRFFDELFDNLDVKVEKFVNQGQSVVKQVQTMQGVNGGTKIIKTEVTQTFGNPVGYRFKRDLFDGIMDSIENKVNVVKDKMAGKVQDVVNIGYEVHDKVHNRLAQRIRS